MSEAVPKGETQRADSVDEEVVRYFLDFLDADSTADAPPVTAEEATRVLDGLPGGGLLHR